MQPSPSGIDSSEEPPLHTAGREVPQARKDQLRQAVQQGDLGLGFSAGGFLYPYFLGVLWELRDLGLLRGQVKMAGASAGSLAVATYNCGLTVEQTMSALLAFAADCRAKGTRLRLGGLLREFLHANLPLNAHEICQGNTFVAVTRVFPVWQGEMISEFKSKDDLVEALCTSCHIPVYATGEWMRKFRGRYYMDGGVMNFLPRPPTPTSITVCCFPVNELLAKLPSEVGSYHPKVAELLDVAISPDAFEPFPYGYRTMVTWALVPAQDDVLRYLVEKGRKDGRLWATAMQLLPDADTTTVNGGAAADTTASQRIVLPTSVTAVRASSSSQAT